MIPPFFKTVPRTSTIHDFFTTHDNKQRSGFITQLDRSPIRQKRTAFVSALALNLVIVSCLAVLAILTVQTNLSGPYPPSMQLAFALTQNILLASAFVALLRSTILPFFLGECLLRYLYGFQETELVIRRSPQSLDLRSYTNCHPDSKGSTLNVESAISLCRLALRLVDPRLLFYRPGALLSSNYWTPEYPIILGAYKRLSTGDMSEDDFDLSVWKQTNSLWTACELWQFQDITNAEHDLRLEKQ